VLTTDRVPGSVCWLDLGSRDIDASAAFYSTLFGWKHYSAGPEAGGYGIFYTADDKKVAAIGPCMEEGTAGAWTLYFQTTDADATQRAVEQAGGVVRMPAMDVFDQGRLAAFTDPTGGRFGVWQPGANKGLEVVSAANSLTWAELYTSDSAAAKSFYKSVFAWDFNDVPVMDFTYSIVSPQGGGEDGSMAGLMQILPMHAEQGMTSAWQPYFEVADCDAAVATAVANGATVQMGPDDLDEVGRMAALTDPVGTAFSVITSIRA
jgi:predicted enzyme related to lactoylglutathione lyase